MALDIESALGAWREPPLLSPPGRAEYGSGLDDDAPERPLRLASDLEGMVLGIIYCSASGEQSERVIRCLTLVSSGGALFISAHCKLRNAPRSFRVDRISAVISHATGEVHEDVEDFLAPFVAELREAPRTQPTNKKAVRRSYAEAPVIQLYGAGASVLSYLASVDGHAHPVERAVIQRYIATRLSLFEPGDAQHVMASRWLDGLLPTRDMAVKAMRRVSADADDAQLVSEAIVDIIAADGDVTDEEIDAARRMIDILARKERKQERQAAV